MRWVTVHSAIVPGTFNYTEIDSPNRGAWDLPPLRKAGGVFSQTTWMALSALSVRLLRGVLPEDRHRFQEACVSGLRRRHETVV